MNTVSILHWPDCGFKRCKASATHVLLGVDKVQQMRLCGIHTHEALKLGLGATVLDNIEALQQRLDNLEIGIAKLKAQL